MQVSGVELNRMGQHENLARYPIHWHLVDEGKGQYIQNSAIHDTFSRCVTVHGTNNVRVQNNVAYNNVGHCYFLEDGVEHGNQYLSNLGILTKCHTSRPCQSTNAVYTATRGPNGQQAKDQLIPSDNTAATFWITNPQNTYIGNVSAGSEATGFWMAFPEHPTGKFEGTEIAAKTWPRRTQLGEISGNVSHSNVEGLMFDRGTNNAGTFNLGGNTHMAYENPQDRNSKQLESTIKDFTIYKSKGAAIWARGEHHIFDGLKIADSAIGYTHAYPGGSPGGAQYTSKVINSLFVGESDNKGTPKTEAEVKYGRTLPRVDADYPVRGFEYYDFTHHVVNTKFVNFQDNDTRKSGAISYLLFTSFPISTANSIEKITFENAKPAYFPPTDARWQFSGEFGRFVGWNGAVFHDKDGSATGKPNSYVVIDNGVVWDEKRCERKPTWNAVACTGDMGRMGISAGGGAARGGPGTVGVAIVPGGGPGGPGAAKGAPGGPGAAKGAPGAPVAAGPGGPGAAKGGPGGPGAAKGGPGGPGAAKGAPGGFGGGGGAQTVLVRGDKKLTLTGDVTMLSGTEIRAESESPTVTVRISEMDAGSWVMVELPGFTTAASGTAQPSLDALRAATATSYFKGQGSLWVKVVSSGNSGVAAGQGPGGRGGAATGGGSITVSKDAAPAAE
jgi:cell migration-inducing and hyaluronan-binding protein